MKLRTRLLQVALVLVFAVGIGAGGVVLKVRSDAKAMHSALLELQAYEGEHVSLALHKILLFPEVTADEQTKILAALPAFESLKSTDDIHADTDRLSLALGSLRPIVTNLASDAQISVTPEFLELRKLSFGEGDVKPLFDTYNQEAFMWNQRDLSTTGRLIGSTLQLKKVLMVHPDGVTEQQTIVSF